MTLQKYSFLTLFLVLLSSGCGKEAPSSELQSAQDKTPHVLIGKWIFFDQENNQKKKDELIEITADGTLSDFPRQRKYGTLQLGPLKKDGSEETLSFNPSDGRMKKGTDQFIVVVHSSELIELQPRSSTTGKTDDRIAFKRALPEEVEAALKLFEARNAPKNEDPAEIQ